MQKMIWVPDNEAALFDEAKHVLGQPSTSAAVLTALRVAIDHQKNATGEYMLKIGSRQARIIGKELDLFRGKRKSPYRAFRTASGRIVVYHVGSEELIRFDGIQDFQANASGKIPEKIFRCITLSIHEEALVEVID